jgi:GntR family transcriptional repressor for pyruvate dehydrogenase complex
MKPLRKSRLYEQVSEVLEQRIRNRQIAAGSELPSERDLMRDFGVGRSAIREALFHLQRMGLVELRAGARARVIEPSPESVVTTLSGSARYLLAAPDGIRHFQEARTLFETGLVRDAARLATDSDIERLKRALEDNRLSIGDVARFEETDVAFHYAIASVPRNPIYTSLHTAIIEWLVDQRHVTLRHPGQKQVAYEAHAAIFAAIAERDEEAAANLMRQHLEQVSALYWILQDGAT